MRLSYTLIVPALLAVGSMAGCGESPGPTQANQASQGQAAAAPKVPSDPVARVVFEFLDAVRQGNTAVASQRLTPLALKRTSEMDFVFAPPGSPTARFQVGGAELVEKDKAVVESVWTDLDADGKPQSEPTLWALRLEEGKWRISGMAAEVGPNQPLMVIDFENPETMMPQPPANPQNVAGSPATPPAGQAGGEVARNPFDQPSQR